MILDKLENHGRLAQNPAIKAAFDFLRGLNPGTENKRYYLDGDRMFVIVKNCETTPGDGAVLEAHRNHIDVHFNIAGDETLEWSPLSALEPKGEYLEQADARLYIRPPADVMRFALPKGHFAAFFPDDAHGTELAAGSVGASLKKAVLKIHLDLLGATGANPTPIAEPTI
ncbi:MAG: YhcH/YjgK/YiaL family protein [Opitutaceae bacterium]